MPRFQYALTRDFGDGHAIVLRTFRCDWLAMLALRLKRRGRHFSEDAQYGVAEIPTSAQEFINVCEDRDHRIRQLRELEEITGGVHPALSTLLALVTKDDDGKWVTVHDEGHELPEHVTKYLDEMVGAA